ncbi:IBR domain-containing protein [Rhizoctonia solani AG-1 IA]|uniref:RBR-type E3 ubiquitin transferase n=1 Tax=Thanatephorus cucumeris (strain AG1-IA) TaxID=983506 RepID=L8WJP1_THACA|nr:IBR domain-containing protein [Rhizoctonia solani AG-1 IA]
MTRTKTIIYNLSDLSHPIQCWLSCVDAPQCHPFLESVMPHFFRSLRIQLLAESMPQVYINMAHHAFTSTSQVYRLIDNNPAIYGHPVPPLSHSPPRSMMDALGSRSEDEYFTISLNPFVSSETKKWSLPPEQVLLSRSTVTYRGRNAYKSKRADAYQQPPPTQVCEICLETRDLLCPTSLCTHESNVCESCLQEYVIHAVKIMGQTRLVCPGFRCKEVLVAALRGAVYSNSIPNSYGAQTQRVVGARYTLKKYVTGPIVTCSYCRAQSCFVHRVPWHENLTCEQYTIDANEEYIATHTKRCPSLTCGRPVRASVSTQKLCPIKYLQIEKSYGCDHMMCRCGHQFYHKRSNATSETPSNTSQEPRSVNGYGELIYKETWAISVTRTSPLLSSSMMFEFGSYPSPLLSLSLGLATKHASLMIPCHPQQSFGLLSIIYGKYWTFI